MPIRPSIKSMRPCFRCLYATVPSASSAPPLLLKLRADLKTAMKAKDTNRLLVLRDLLSETANAAKTSSPIKTDIQLLSLLRKRAATSELAASEFGAANRSDLKEKEDAQIAILEEYAGTVNIMGADEIRESIHAVVDTIKAEGRKLELGGLLKRLVGPGGVLDGKPAQKAEVAQLAKEILEIENSSS